MCMRQNRKLVFESAEEAIDDPIRGMREPPGALGDIVRRMKQHALERSVPLRARSGAGRGTA